MESPERKPSTVRLLYVGLIWGLLVVILQFPWGGGNDTPPSTCYGMFGWWTVPCEAWLTTAAGVALGLLVWLVLLEVYVRMATRVLAIALLLEAIWIGIGGLLAIGLELVAFEEVEARAQGIDGWAFGLAGLVAALTFAAVAIWLLTRSRPAGGGMVTAAWLVLAGLANAGLAVFWIVMSSGQVDAPIPVIQFVVIFLTMAALCLVVAWRMGPVRWPTGA